MSEPGRGHKRGDLELVRDSGQCLGMCPGLRVPAVCFIVSGHMCVSHAALCE